MTACHHALATFRIAGRRFLRGPRTVWQWLNLAVRKKGRWTGPALAKGHFLKRWSEALWRSLGGDPPEVVSPQNDAGRAGAGLVAVNS